MSRYCSYCLTEVSICKCCYTKCHIKICEKCIKNVPSVSFSMFNLHTHLSRTIHQSVCSMHCYMEKLIQVSMWRSVNIRSVTIDNKLMEILENQQIIAIFPKIQLALNDLLIKDINNIILDYIACIV